MVRFRAVPLTAELVGTNTGTDLRVVETASKSLGLSAGTKSGFEVGVVGGANIGPGVGPVGRRQRHGRRRLLHLDDRQLVGRA